MVYNPVSGDTHLLNLVEQTALEEIESAGRVTFEELAESLLERLEIDDRAQLETYLQTLLQQFEEVGLISCQSSVVSCQ